MQTILHIKLDFTVECTQSQFLNITRTSWILLPLLFEIEFRRVKHSPDVYWFWTCSDNITEDSSSHTTKGKERWNCVQMAWHSSSYWYSSAIWNLQWTTVNKDGHVGIFHYTQAMALYSIWCIFLAICSKSIGLMQFDLKVCFSALFYIYGYFFNLRQFYIPGLIFQVFILFSLTFLFVIWRSHCKCLTKKKKRNQYFSSI